MALEAGAAIPLSIDLTSVDDGVLVSLDTAVDLVGECVRCLDLVRAHREVHTTDVFVEPSSPLARGPEDEDSDALDGLRIIGLHDTVDVEPVLRDAIIPLVDDRPLCRPTCAGLCAVCGEKLDDLPPDHHHDVIDPRLAGLAALLESDDVEEDLSNDDAQEAEHQ
ncbi:MAG TPA: DUF177 domain-containing protein [Lacisediminihabitans sp.]|uniref:YceD family protein n=1 Tax=Lacisediminihabitans sp. TaxID=2787631 RepID=UPI002EDAF147